MLRRHILPGASRERTVSPHKVSCAARIAAWCRLHDDLGDTGMRTKFQGFKQTSPTLLSLSLALALAGCGSDSTTPDATTSGGTIGGTVAGLIGTVVLRLNSDQTLEVSADGAFTFPSTVPDGTAYTVTVTGQPYMQQCTLEGNAGTVSGANVTSVAVQCGPLPLALLSLSSGGVKGNEHSGYPVVSADGRYVAFESDADNLVPGDTNLTTDIFVRDRVSNTTTRVSVTSNGVEADFGGQNPSISADGRFVAFESGASNLAEPCDGSTWHVFVHDRNDGSTTCVSVNAAGFALNGWNSNPAISADGRYVAFLSTANNHNAADEVDPIDSVDAFVYDRTTGILEAVSVNGSGRAGSDFSYLGSPYYPTPAISANGRYVAFASDAMDLLPNDDNDARDVFVRDRQEGMTLLVSETPTGGYGNGDSGYGLDRSIAMSADGRHIAFTSSADNLLSVPDSNGVDDVFVRDMNSGITIIASVESDGTASSWHSLSPSISSDGRYVAFVNGSPADLVGPGISTDGLGSDEVFLHDTSTRQTRLVSVNADGAPSGGSITYATAMSGDGNYVVYSGYAVHDVNVPDLDAFDDIYAAPLR